MQSKHWNLKKINFWSSERFLKRQADHYYSEQTYTNPLKLLLLLMFSSFFFSFSFVFHMIFFLLFNFEFLLLSFLFLR